MRHTLERRKKAACGMIEGHREYATSVVALHHMRQIAVWHVHLDLQSARVEIFIFNHWNCIKNSLPVISIEGDSRHMWFWAYLRFQEVQKSDVNFVKSSEQVNDAVVNTKKFLIICDSIIKFKIVFEIILLCNNFLTLIATYNLYFSISNKWKYWYFYNLF